ncbi:MAG: proteobacterial dedicated sortase system response regulator [Pseudomonadota bacterium]
MWRIVASTLNNPTRWVAIVEDDAALGQNYCEAFEREGYRTTLDTSRAAALARFEAALPDLVIIDINLGDDVEGGFELCRALRARSATLPVVFLTARDSEFDAVSGLRLGADDYLTKDIGLAHLLARVAALFRRQAALREQTSDGGAGLVCGSLRIDESRFTAYWSDTPVPLTLTEYWLVVALARFPGHVKNRQQLMDAANTVLDDNTVTSHIKRIRRKFQAIDPDFDAIETVYGMGYRWRPA